MLNGFKINYIFKENKYEKENYFSSFVGICGFYKFVRRRRVGEVMKAAVDDSTSLDEVFDRLVEVTIHNAKNEGYFKRKIKKLTKNERKVVEHALGHYDLEKDKIYFMVIGSSPFSNPIIELFIRTTSSKKLKYDIAGYYTDEY